MNCIGLQHAYNRQETRDYHRIPEQSVKWHQCQTPLCKQRYQKIFGATRLLAPYEATTLKQEETIKTNFTEAKRITPIPPNQTPHQSPVLPVQRIPSVGSRLDPLPPAIPEQPDRSNHSSDDKEDDKTEHTELDTDRIEVMSATTTRKEEEQEAKVSYKFHYKGIEYMGRFRGTEPSGEKEINERFPDATDTEKTEILQLLKTHIIVYPAEATNIS